MTTFLSPPLTTAENEHDPLVRLITQIRLRHEAELAPLYAELARREAMRRPVVVVELEGEEAEREWRKATGFGDL